MIWYKNANSNVVIILVITCYFTVIRGQLVGAGGKDGQVGDDKGKKGGGVGQIPHGKILGQAANQGNQQQSNQAQFPRFPAPADMKAPAVDRSRPANDGDNIAGRPECAVEIDRYCRNVPRREDFQILKCLQDLDQADTSLSEPCQHMLWEFKLNLTQDEGFKRMAQQHCREPIEKSDCGRVTSERGHMISCLSEMKDVLPDGDCKRFLTDVESIIFTDFRLVGPFVTACREDVRKLSCGQLEDDRKKETPQAAGQPGQPGQQAQQGQVMPHSQGATLDCIMQKMVNAGFGKVQLDPKCSKEISRLTELQADDYHLDRPLFFACRQDREKYCSQVMAGQGRVFQCLASHRYENEMTRECQETLDVRLQLLGRDYKMSKQLVQSCRKEMKDYQCEVQLNDPNNPPPSDHMYLSYVILCLEEAGRRIGPNNQYSAECQRQVFEHRRLLFSDYRMDPEIVLACSQEISKHCGDQIQVGGRTLHCLMNRIRLASVQVDNVCIQAVTKLMQGVDVGNDYRVDRVLYADCQHMIDSVCHQQATSHTDVLSCLMLNVQSPSMTDACESRLLEVQYFLARDFKLDPQLYQACKADAASKCGDSGPWTEKAVLPAPPMQGQPQQQQQQQQQQQTAQGPERGYLVLTCLYRHAYSDDPKDKPAPQCTQQVQRVMRERAMFVNLMPQIEDACLKDLAEKCSKRTGQGEEIRCLQENLRGLEKGCQDQVRIFTEQQGMDARLNQAVLRACGPVLEKHCAHAMERAMDQGEIMECLVKNKGTPDMNDKCRTFVHHYELVTLGDYRFTYKFQHACNDDIEKYCVKPGVKDKATIVGCLSEILVKRALLETNEDLSEGCRNQLRVEYFAMERSETNLGDPKLVDSCQNDLKKYCDLADNAAAAFECLREHKTQLEPLCRKYVFKKEKLEFQDNSFDVMLNRVCADEIRSYCAQEQPERVLQCLKVQLEQDGTRKSRECYQLVKRRKIEQAGDIRLQPMLARACDAELRSVCSEDLKKVRNRPEEEANGIVISCLRKYVTARQKGVIISAGCQVEVRRIIYESEVDVNLDPPFYIHCKEEIMNRCSQQLMAQDGHESILECMKYQFKKGVIASKDCKQELARKINEELADIHLDPELNMACATDLQHYCEDIKSGDGKLLKCLLDASKSSNVHLTQQCHAKLMDREQLWRSIKQDNLPINIPGDVGAVVRAVYHSPARNTLATVLLVVVAIVFLVGFCGGRVTRRIKREMKNR